MINLKIYKMIYYSLLRKFINRENIYDLIIDAIYVLNLLVILNFFSILFLINIFIVSKLSYYYLFSILFIVPCLNYLIFLKEGRKKLIDKIKIKIKEDRIKPFSYFVKYTILTIIVFMISIFINYIT